MPPIVDEIEELESSPSPKDEQAGKPAQEVADPSPAQGAEDDLLSVVRDVVAKDRGEKPSEASPAEGVDKEGTEAGEPAPQVKTDDETYSDVPFNKHPRFQQLLRQRNAALEDAERYHNVERFLDQQGVTGDEAAEALSIAGLAKTDPAKAWEQVKPWVQKLLIAAGEVLPDELRQRVDKGQLTREAAMEISRERARANTLTAQQEFAQQRAKRQADEGQARGVTEAVGAWEADRRKRDPNFDAKMPLIQREIAYLQRQEGIPRTPEAVREQLAKAYKEANSRFRAPVAAVDPKAQRPEIKPVVSGASTGPAAPASKSTLDIVRANRRKAG